MVAAAEPLFAVNVSAVSALEVSEKTTVLVVLTNSKPFINLSFGKVTAVDAVPAVLILTFSTFVTNARFTAVKPVLSTYKVSVPAPPFTASEAEKVIVAPDVPAKGAFKVSLPAPPVMVSVPVVSDLWQVRNLSI